jgi:NAD(P)H-flavin reductase
MKISFEGSSYDANASETVLDTLLRNKVSVPYSCKSGVCQSCKLKVVEGDVSADSQRGLTDAEVEAGFFLPCSCEASGDLVVTFTDDHSLDQTIAADVVEKIDLSNEIMRLRIKPSGDYSYKGGQFLNVFKDENTTRSYSLASSAALEGFLEFHIQRLPKGHVSGWLHDEVSVGDTIHISKPLGECYYRPGKETTPLLLVATGSGFAPVWAVLRFALASGHSAPIHVYHGSSREDGVYLREEMAALAAQHANLHYTPCVSGDEVAGLTKGRANELALADNPELKGWTVYLCGHPEMVADTRKKAFLAGASFADIYADPFTHA